MEQRINIAELLKDCPKGMELYSTIYGTVYFEGVRDTGYAVLIDVKTSCNTEVQFYPDGKLNTYYSDSEMTLFPSKDVRNWEGFHRPFKDGDIVVYDNPYYNYRGHPGIFIFKDKKVNNPLSTCYLMLDGDVLYLEEGMYYVTRFATEEEKEKLFQAIKDNGYKWNAETKTLEKLVEPRFKVGNTIQDENGYKVKITEVNLEDECYGYESIIVKGIGGIAFSEQDTWKLVPGKFDITTLKPFDKVLVRDSGKDMWRASIFSHPWVNKYFCIGIWYSQCIPYKGNEHLLGTTDDCDEFYKIWE